MDRQKGGEQNREEERRYLGTLLDDEVFHSSQQSQVPNVTTQDANYSTTSQVFWAEPPPPYSPNAPYWAALKQPAHLMPNTYYTQQQSKQFTPQYHHIPKTRTSPDHQSTKLNWDSVYTPFGPVQAQPTTEQTHRPSLEARNSTPSDPRPRVKSYRDVASKTTESSNRSNLSNSSRNNSNSQTPSTNRRTTTAQPIKQQRRSSGTESENKNDVKTVYEQLARKGNKVDPKNLSQCNVTTNTPNSEFTKITRKKGAKEKTSSVATGGKIEGVGGGKNSTIANKMVLNNDGTTIVKRFDVLTTNENTSKIGNEHKLNNQESVRTRLLSLPNNGTSSSTPSTTTFISNDLSDRTLGSGGSSKKSAKKRDVSDSVAIDRRKKTRKKNGETVWNYLAVCFVTFFSLVQSGGRWLIDLITDIASQLYDIIFYFTRTTCARLIIGCQFVWHQTMEKMRNFLLSFSRRNWYSCLPWRRRQFDSAQWGLPESIQLPSTGEEAMCRLLSCAGQDAYCILGLRCDCSDEEIKRYYKKQAVLVHPDKNQSNGADEAFKLLAHAFKCVGTPATRANYNLEKVIKDPVFQKEMSDLMERFRDKMNVDFNTMQCDCGEKHRRFPVDFRASEARFCRKCKERHPAKDNDIWAESRWWGCLWYYYACMGGAVYDITEWAGCPKNQLKHMKANSHTIQYRLISAKSNNDPMQQQSPTNNKRKQSRNHSANNELDDIFSQYLDRRCSDTLVNTSQASYRPPERNCGGDSRPRKAGRRRRIK